MLHKVIVSGGDYIPHGEYNFGTVTKLSGHNGAGKTSLMKSVLVSLTGLGTSLVPEPDCIGDSEVELHFDDFVIRRKRHNGKTTNWLNDNIVSQEEIIAKSVYISPRIFAIMMWPMLFFRLSTTDRKRFLLAVTPEVNLNKIAVSHFGCDLPEGTTEKNIEDTRKLVAKLKSAVDRDLLRIESTINIPTDYEQIRVLYQKDWDEYLEKAKLYKETQEKHAALKKAIENCESSAEYKQLVAREKEFVGKRQSIAYRSEALRRMIAETETQLKTFAPECPTCKRKWNDPEARKEMLTIKLTSLNEEVAKNTADLNDVISSHENIKSVLAEKLRIAKEKVGDVPEVYQMPQPVKRPDERLAEWKQIVAASNAKREQESARLMKQNELLEKQLNALNLRTGVQAVALETKLKELQLPNFHFGIIDDKLEIQRIQPFASIDDLSSGEKIRFCIELSKALAGNKRFEPKVKLMFIERADLLDGMKMQPGFQLVVERVEKEQSLMCEVLK